MELITYLLNLALGFLFVQFVWFPNIILPFFYGIPKATYHSIKGTLQAATITRYLLALGIWVIASIGIAIFLAYLLGSLRLSNRDAFEAGSLFAFVFAIWFSVTTKGRVTLARDFWAYNANYAANEALYGEYAGLALAKYWAIYPDESPMAGS
jgi:hypothetical protein